MQRGGGEVDADIPEGFGMGPRLGAQAVRKVQEEQPGERMHPAADIQKPKVSIEWLQELVELIDRVPMCRQLIHSICEIGERRPESFVARGTNGLFVVELIAFEPGTSGRCA